MSSPLFAPSNTHLTFSMAYSGVTQLCLRLSLSSPRRNGVSSSSSQRFWSIGLPGACCKSSLNQSGIKHGVPDKWIWEANIEGVFTVRSAYRHIQDCTMEEDVPAFKSLWEAFAPTSAIFFGWRALWNRVQTKDNLYKRRIIDEASLACSLCNEAAESLEHLLFACPVATDVWDNYHSWMGILTVAPKDCSLHFLQHNCGFWSKNQRRGTSAIWLSIVWSLWLHRNDCLFKDSAANAGRILELAKVRAWSWLHARSKRFRFSFYEWQANPRFCLARL